jgi:UDP-glucose 4-epimerase
MAKALVTGGAGFIGSNLVDALVERGDEVVVIDDLSTGKKENINSKATFHQADIKRVEEIEHFFKGVENVFHLAAVACVQTSIEEPIRVDGVNLRGTLSVLEASRRAGARSLVYSSSSAVYGNQEGMPLSEDMPARPLSPYGLQKYAGELYCRLYGEIYGLSTISLRYFNVYGPRQRMEGAYCPVIGIFARQRAAGEEMTITGDGEQSRDFVFVSDVARANILASKAAQAGGGGVVNIGSGKSYSVNDIAGMIGGPKRYVEPRIEPRESLAEISRAKDFLGWEPEVDLQEWIREYKREYGI